MRIFVLRARKGMKQHAEIIAHVIMNVFYISSDFRRDVALYIVFDATEKYPITLHLDASKGLSLPGFNELALLNFINANLAKASLLGKNEIQTLSPGVTIAAFGFEKLIASLMEQHVVYSLNPKGVLLTDLIEQKKISNNPVFVLSDNLAMPKKVLQSMQRKGMQALSLGKTLLFASQCISIIHYELDK